MSLVRQTPYVPIERPPADECSFCVYLDGGRPYTIVDRDDVCALFVTWEQRGLGHVLVVPIAHRETILDLDQEESQALMSGTVRAARAIQAAFDPAGIVVWQNNGVPAHQSVPHVHMHVAGTVPGGRTIDGPVPRLSLLETEAIADRLRPHLGAG